MLKKSYDERELEITSRYLKRAFDKFGIVEVIGELFDEGYEHTKGIDIAIPIKDEVKLTFINELPFNDKSRRSLLQYTLKMKQDETIENILPLISKYTEEKSRGIGKRRLAHIKAVILQACYDALDVEQKEAFCYEFLKRNCY